MDRLKIAYNNAWKFSFTPKGKALAKEKTTKSKGYVDVLLGDKELLVPATAQDFNLLKHGGYEIMVEKTTFRSLLGESDLKKDFDRLTNHFDTMSRDIFKVPLKDAFVDMKPGSLAKYSPEQQIFIKEVFSYIKKNYKNSAVDLVSMLIDPVFRKKVSDSALARKIIRQLKEDTINEIIDEVLGESSLEDELTTLGKESSDDFQQLKDWYYSMVDGMHEDMPKIKNPEILKEMKMLDKARKAFLKVDDKSDLGKFL